MLSINQIDREQEIRMKVVTRADDPDDMFDILPIFRSYLSFGYITQFLVL